ncbi:MAG: FemAB family protein [Gammaproteobacteria bacterium]|nr:FemAB family protein [Gammaproteobacteria bacterium]
MNDDLFFKNKFSIGCFNLISIGKIYESRYMLVLWNEAMRDTIYKIAEDTFVVKFLDKAELDWNFVIQNATTMPIYTLSHNRFLERYMIGVTEEFFSLSMVLFHDLKPVGVWPLSIKKTDGFFSLCSNACNVIAPLFIKKLPEKIQKELVRYCLDYINKVCKKLFITEWKSEHFIYEKGVDAWYKAVMLNSISCHVTTELYVDLRLPFEAIWSMVRKSFRALVNKGSELWKIDILKTEDRATFSEFQRLHFLVAGRVTRSDESWEENYKAIVSGDAFLVFLRDESGRMIGGGFFEITAYAGLYSVAAYDRALFDLPLGHVVQIAAIKYMQQLGLSLYHIGRRYHQSDIPKPTEKEISISIFKEGFATCVFPKIHVQSLIN